jgi:hypothetical protein
VPVEVKHLIPEVLNFKKISLFLISLKPWVSAVVYSKAHLLAMLNDRITFSDEVEFSIHRIVDSDLL